MKQWNWCKMLQIRGIQYTPLIHDKLICTKLGHNIGGYFPSHIRVCTLERLSIHIYIKRQMQNCTMWPSFPFTCYLLFVISTHKLVVSRILFCPKEYCFELFLSAHFHFLRNSQLDFAVIYNDKAPLLTCISVQGCGLTKIEGSPVLWTCKIQGAQHMICTKNLRFSSCPGAKVGRQGPPGSAGAQLGSQQMNKKRRIRETKPTKRCCHPNSQYDLTRPLWRFVLPHSKPAIKQLNTFAPEPPVTAHADPRPSYRLWRHQFKWSRIILSANSWRVKRSFKPCQNEHHSVKDTGEKGKKPCNIDP